MSEKVAVIGAGIGGIAVAARLAAKGYEVSVFEKNDHAGGKLSQIRHDGYRFDTGPSLFTLPGLIKELFELAQEDFESNFRYEKLPLVCRYFYHDEMVIDALAGAEEFAGELNRKAQEDPGKVLAYLDECRKIYEITHPVFIANSLHLGRNYLSADFFRSLFRLHKLQPFRTLHHINSKSFRHPNTVMLFDRFATYNGSDPYRTPATMRVIAHLEHNTGAYFPLGGMYEIARKLT
ncbi:MAG: FAD-dependent oxidoreductase, partial [Bacteroidales bacterium]|nr:FAD-dependent oxidoreductase [Bacteroidales bacterium]